MAPVFCCGICGVPPRGSRLPARVRFAGGKQEAPTESGDETGAHSRATGTPRPRKLFEKSLTKNFTVPRARSACARAPAADSGPPAPLCWPFSCRFAALAGFRPAPRKLFEKSLTKNFIVWRRVFRAARGKSPAAGPRILRRAHRPPSPDDGCTAAQRDPSPSRRNRPSDRTPRTPRAAAAR